MISLAPSFIESDSSQQFLRTTYEEKPEPQEIRSLLRDKNFYIFIVDRSGSMAGSKMEITKQALVLFLKSLPSDCMFEVVSFGSRFSLLSDQILGNTFAG